ncbi:MAG: outer membrane protein assembly factor BamD [Gammaproteobacteria bacterium]
MQKLSLYRFTSIQMYAVPVILIVIFLIASCSSNPEHESDSTTGMSAEEIYNEAQAAMKDGNYDTAVDLFEKLETNFPYGPYARQAKLEIIYSHFQYDNLESAIIAAERFIKLYPNHPHVDYAYYMRGVSRYDMETSIFDTWFDQDLTERDPESARDAFKYFNQLLIKFPKSIYNADARKRMIFLRSSLAKHEIHVAKYYFKRRAYVAAVNRSKYVINNYQNTSSVKDALKIMTKAYTKLKLPKLAEDVQRVLEKNYPEKS